MHLYFLVGGAGGRKVAGRDLIQILAQRFRCWFSSGYFSWCSLSNARICYNYTDGLCMCMKAGEESNLEIIINYSVLPWENAF